MDQLTKTTFSVDQNKNKKGLNKPKDSKASQVFDSAPIDKKDNVVLENKFALRNASSKSIKNMNDSDEKNSVTYIIDDGVVVTQGDIILAEVEPGALLKSLSGKMQEPSVQIWPTNEIPFFIQPNVMNPERINHAFGFFANSNIHFVPYTNQEDAIVFEKGQGSCKSYLGYIGGHQKIFISEACSAREIAHEIMHSLGFIHEQNRTDRDRFVDILWNNVNPNFKVNFEKFSSSMMKVSGLSDFDFESIMIYPDSMFSINNQPTMRSKIENQSIAPSTSFSVKDIERINAVY